MFYGDVFRALGERRVRYAVAGGIALVLHGVVRLTVDLDIMLDLSQGNIEKFLAVMSDLCYAPKQHIKAEDLCDPMIRTQWKEEKNMVVCSFYHSAKPMQVIDVFIEEQISFQEIEKEMVWFEAADVKIPAVSRKHLKQLKLLAQRPQDIADVEILNALEKDEENI